MIWVNICMYLRINPVNFGSVGCIILLSVFLDLGIGEILINVSNNSLTPKLFTAEPKNTGATFPSKY